MSTNSKYIFIASMDVDSDKDNLFNEVYDLEHVPNLLKVPGVLSVTRLKMRELSMLIGGQQQTMEFKNEPKYHALYEIECPKVLLSDQWGQAVEAGRWPQLIRPYTRNRRHILTEQI